MGIARTTITGDGNTDGRWSGGSGTFFATGSSFGGGTVKLQWSIDGGTTYVDYPSGSLTANGKVDINPPLGGCNIRINMAGSTNPNVQIAAVEVAHGRG